MLTLLKKIVPFLCIALTALCLQKDFGQHVQSFEGHAHQNNFVDSAVILDGARSHPTFRSTLTWWDGPWIQRAHNAFYRPLTSLLFWAQFWIFGDSGLAGFWAVQAFLNFCFALGLFALVMALFQNRWLATLTSCFF